MKITEIQIFDYSHIHDCDHGEFSANIIIDNKWVLQIGTDGRFSIPSPEEACCEWEEDQEGAQKNYSADEIAEKLEIPTTLEGLERYQADIEELTSPISPSREAHKKHETKGEDSIGKSNWKFEKYIFDVFINSWGIAMYSDGKRLKLVQENVNERSSENELIFDTEGEYDEWIDKIVSDRDAVYNKARALYSVLTVIDDKWR